MERQPTVFLVDDDRHTQEVVRELSRLMNLRCEIFGSGEEFLTDYETSRPGCLLLELRNSSLNGLEVQRELADIDPILPVVFLAERATVSMAVQAMRNGAVHFLEKPFRDYEVWDAIQEAVSLDQRRRLLRNQQELLDKRIGRLSEAQRELMQQIANGKTNRKIAAELEVSVRTIEKRRSRLMETLQARTMFELMRFALRARDSNPLQATAASGRTNSGRLVRRVLHTFSK